MVCYRVVAGEDKHDILNDEIIQIVKPPSSTRLAEVEQLIST